MGRLWDNFFWLLQLLGPSPPKACWRKPGGTIVHWINRLFSSTSASKPCCLQKLVKEDFLRAAYSASFRRGAANIQRVHTCRKADLLPSTLGQLGLTLGGLWQTLGGLWVGFGSTLGRLWADPGLTLGRLWADSGPTLAQLLIDFGPTFGQAWTDFVLTLGRPWVVIILHLSGAVILHL